MRHLADSLLSLGFAPATPHVLSGAHWIPLRVRFRGGACLVTRFSRRTCESRKVAHHRSRLLLRSLPAAE